MSRPRAVPEPAQYTLFDAEPVPVRPGRIDTAPADVPLAEAPLPAIFRHPRAQRELRLGAHVVAYELRRARRRSIGFVVGREGLSVAAPRWVSLADIESALHERARWILDKLAEQQALARRLQAARVDWREGACIPFLGTPVTLALDARRGPSAGATLLELAAGGGSPQRLLRVGLPPAATREQLREAVQGWLQRQARRVFEERCAHYAPLLKVRVRRIALSSAQTRWGSASIDGSVRLNWRLIHFALPTIDYVVAHELAHLRHMDHSPQFWGVVRSVIPDVEAARGRLKDDVLPVFD
jgi:predicted metal-dependent hydrolase